MHIVLGFPADAYHDPDYYATLLLSTLLGGGMSSRLFQEVREKRGLVYAVSTFAAPIYGWRGRSASMPALARARRRS